MMQKSAKKLVYPKQILLAVFLCGLIVLASKLIYTQLVFISPALTESETETDLASIVAPEFFHEKAIETGMLADPGLALYRSDVSKADVIWFYSHITGNEKITRIILENASRNNISPALAFSLAWVESRYQPKAVNNNSTSVDRGLFQLNNRAFPNMTEKDFFNVEKNAHFGLSHLRYCIELSGNEVAGLAMYNAGTTKVRSDKTPKRTLDYVSRILSYKDGLHKLFNQQIANRYSVDEAGKVTLTGKK